LGDNDCSPAGLGFVYGLFQFSLSDILNGLIDGQNKVFSGHGCFQDFEAVFSIFGILKDEALAFLSLQQAVIPVFNPTLTAVIDIDSSQNMRGPLALRIKSFVLFIEMDGGQFELFHPLCIFRLDFPFDPDPGFAIFKSFFDRRRFFR